MKTTKRQTTRRGKSCWEVDFGVVDGTRLRKYFDTETKADEAIDAFEKELRKVGEFFARMKPDRRQALAQVVREIEGEGYEVREVWESFKRWRDEDGRKKVEHEITFEDAVEEFRKRKKAAGKDEEYIDETCDLLLRFGEGQLKRLIHTIKSIELEEWIHAQGWAPTTLKSNMGRFSSLWTVAEDRGWASLNIVDRLEQVGKIRKEVKIWPNDTTLRLMAASLVSGKAIAPLSLGLFGCMRPEEISHPDWGWPYINLKWGQITVPAPIAKDGDQRTIQLQPVALEWLKLAKEKGNELPLPNERKLIDECCELAGIVEWPHDILRKVCATHLSGLYKNDWSVIRDMGNSIRILLGHYKALQIPEEVSLEHWKISPAAAEAKLKEMLTSSAKPPTQSASETSKA